MSTCLWVCPQCCSALLVHRDINQRVLCVSIPTCSSSSLHRDINHCVLCVSTPPPPVQYCQCTGTLIIVFSVCVHPHLFSIVSAKGHLSLCSLCVSILTCSALLVHRDINQHVLCVSILTCSALFMHRDINRCVLCVSIPTCLALSVYRDINHCVLCVRPHLFSIASLCVCPSPTVQHYQCRSWSALQDVNKMLSAWLIHPTSDLFSIVSTWEMFSVVGLPTPTCSA